MMFQPFNVPITKTRRKTGMECVGGSDKRYNGKTFYHVIPESQRSLKTC